MLLKQLFVLLIGLCAGGVVSAGLFALISVLGVIVRFAKKTDTGGHIKLYESCIVFGASLANIMWVYGLDFHIFKAGALLFGFFAGIFTGCMAVALAETIKAIPIMARRLKITIGAAWIVVCLAIGKSVGGFIYFINRWQ